LTNQTCSPPMQSDDGERGTPNPQTRVEDSSAPQIGQCSSRLSLTATHGVRSRRTTNTTIALRRHLGPSMMLVCASVRSASVGQEVGRRPRVCLPPHASRPCICNSARTVCRNLGIDDPAQSSGLLNAGRKPQTLERKGVRSNVRSAERQSSVGERQPPPRATTLGAT